MAPTDPTGSTLSAQRAFVVHLGSTGGSSGRLSGRVEHLSSGQSARFASLRELLAFFSAIVEGAAPPARIEAERRPRARRQSTTGARRQRPREKGGPTLGV